MSEKDKISDVEKIKADSRFLRGTLQEGLENLSTGAFSSNDQQLLKFHGMYQQDDRDVRSQRRKYKLEKAFSFMLRIRVPGGRITPEQWLAIDEMSDRFGNGNFKLTTRQAFQLHGVIKGNLKGVMKEIQQATMDTIAACGDVNRNVMCAVNPSLSPIQRETLEIAQAISDHLTPRSGAYAEIWLDGEKVDTSKEEEPIYGKVYLPRKFKIAVAVPPSNDVDIHANDLSFVAILEKEKLIGFNVLVGGGMGMTHGQKETYPRVADLLGFIDKERVVDVAEKVVLTQRDFGNRENRKQARLKYTIDTLGLEKFRQEVEKRLGYSLELPREFQFTGNGDFYGWQKGEDGLSHFTLFVEGGRIFDKDSFKLREALREIAKIHQGSFYLTPNQNLLIADISVKQESKIKAILKKWDLEQAVSGIRGHSLACVALPTCSLALAEAERYLPNLLNELEEVIDEAGLRNDAITIRMTGCPNGCARPYLAEIGLVGRSPHKYHLYLGGGFLGDRLGRLFQADVKDDEIVEVLRPLIFRYAKEREEGEKFGDFVIRSGVVNESQKNSFHIE